MENITILIISLALEEAYTWGIIIWKGRQKSISASADLKKDSKGRSWLFLIWVTVVAFPLGFVANNYLCAIGAVLLTGIGYFTGFNPNMFKKKTQQTIHTALVLIAILLFEAGLFMINHYMAVGITIAICLSIFVWGDFKETRIWRIEKIIIYQVYASLLIYNL